MVVVVVGVVGVVCFVGETLFSGPEGWFVEKMQIRRSLKIEKVLLNIKLQFK